MKKRKRVRKAMMRKLKNYKPTRFMAKTSHYDEYAANVVVTFIEQLKHTKGEFYKKPFILIDWQEQIIRDIFGILKPDGYRQFTTAYIEVPKKCGKSELAAAVALYMLCADGEQSDGDGQAEAGGGKDALVVRALLQAAREQREGQHGERAERAQNPDARAAADHLAVRVVGIQQHVAPQEEADGAAREGKRAQGGAQRFFTQGLRLQAGAGTAAAIIFLYYSISGRRWKRPRKISAAAP
jgi:hypothetical protein